MRLYTVHGKGCSNRMLYHSSKSGVAVWLDTALEWYGKRHTHYEDFPGTIEELKRLQKELSK